MDNVVKQTELLEKTGVYDEDLKRRFALTLRTIHPLFAGQRFSGKWEFRNFEFSEEK